jgi:hypothetical protein
MPGPATAFVTGQLGAGVSAVAIVVARVLRGRFPDGVRHVRLQGLNADARLDDVIAAKLVFHSLGGDARPGLGAGSLPRGAGRPRGTARAGRRTGRLTRRQVDTCAADVRDHRDLATVPRATSTPELFGSLWCTPC